MTARPLKRQLQMGEGERERRRTKKARLIIDWFRIESWKVGQREDRMGRDKGAGTGTELHRIWEAKCVCGWVGSWNGGLHPGPFLPKSGPPTQFSVMKSAEPPWSEVMVDSAEPGSCQESGSGG